MVTNEYPPPHEKEERMLQAIVMAILINGYCCDSRYFRRTGTLYSSVVYRKETQFDTIFDFNKRPKTKLRHQGMKHETTSNSVHRKFEFSMHRCFRYDMRLYHPSVITVNVTTVHVYRRVIRSVGFPPKSLTVSQHGVRSNRN